MSGDTLVYDMSSMSEGTPQVFVKKDFLQINDNQNGNYNGNQSVVDTSQLANSNKYMNYREAYLSVPLVLTVSSTSANLIDPAVGASSVDMGFGLRNWFGSIVHSFTLDYNGTTIIQQTPYCGMFNTFRLMTTLSLQDVATNGASMGFYPDDPLSFGFSVAGGNLNGLGTFNNINGVDATVVSGQFTGFNRGNEGFLKRQQYISYDPDASTAGGATFADNQAAFSTLLPATACVTLYKSFISKKQAYSAAPFAPAVIQYSIMSFIQLKHLHNFFQNIPLLKGVFMKMTINLNQSSLTLTTTNAVTTGFGNTPIVINSPLGGVSPIMIASASGAGVDSGLFGGIDFTVTGVITASIAVGQKPIVSSQSTLTTGLAPSIQLNVPAYTFNPVFEDAYLADPVKTIVYSDIYQYQVLSVASGATFNSLITNGIANIKSVLILPFFTSTANGGIEPFQSPFTGEGSGTTSPLCLLTSFNVVVAGQNMIYNTQQYSYQQFLEQLQGCNAVNANQTDGLTSSLVSQLGFEMMYNYYYVNCSRMLPVEESVPKSVSIIGRNQSAKAINLFVFIEYGVQVSVDVLTGARV
jgi:hypothetical protein